MPDIFTTAGDMVYATGADAAARLALGTTRAVIEAGASAPTYGPLRPVSGQFMGAVGADRHTEGGAVSLTALEDEAVTFANAFSSAPNISESQNRPSSPAQGDFKRYNLSASGVNFRNDNGSDAASGNWVAEGPD